MVRGGGETFDLEIALHLQKLGCSVSFLSGKPMLSGAAIPFGIRHSAFGSYCIRSPYFGWFPWDRVRGGWRLRTADFWMFEKRAAAWAFARRAEFDVVQVCELPTFVTEWKRRQAEAPVVMRLTAPDYRDEAGAIRIADAVIASGHTMEKVRADARPDCVDIPNGVDAERFTPHRSEFRDRAGIGRDELVVLLVARFQAVKNHGMLIDAFAELKRRVPSARLVLAGSGPLEGEARARCAARGVADRVLFLGEVPFDDLPDVYAAADVHAISSDYESFCFAALEAMASGLPLAVTDTDWVPRLVGKEEGRGARGEGAESVRECPGGMVVPVGDARGMAEALCALAEDAALRRRMAQRNRERAVAGYGWEASAKTLMGVYQRLAGGGPR